MNLEALYINIQRDFPQRFNAQFGTTFVPGWGNPSPIAVLVGEAPGREEEIARRPFIGPAGRNLDFLLKHHAIPKQKLFYTNILKYRPIRTTPHGLTNRKPTRREIHLAMDWIQQELHILRPSIVVCLGMTALQALAPELRNLMGELSGTIIQKPDYALFACYHPSPLNWNMPTKKQHLIEAFNTLSKLIFQIRTSQVRRKAARR